MICEKCGLEYSTAGSNRHIGCPEERDALRGRDAAVGDKDVPPTAAGLKIGEKETVGKTEIRERRKYFKRGGAEGKK
ncbi:MAG: hypothetical protein A2Y94_14015 [Caldithrix sp. RBG_13_44_9]|nr:MAG: hypothetical protein A2Y94_14015 [Caldithrix sp. RBG_13_44_9]